MGKRAWGWGTWNSARRELEAPGKEKGGRERTLKWPQPFRRGGGVKKGQRFPILGSSIQGKVGSGLVWREIVLVLGDICCQNLRI